MLFTLIKEFFRLRIASLIPLLAAFCAIASALPVNAQEPDILPTPQPTPEVRVEDDPTKPIVFSLRNEYRNLKNDAWANTVLARFDKVTFRNLGVKKGVKGLILRVDLPLNTVHAGAKTQTGLGDIYFQALNIPYIRPKFALALGTGIILPTATSDLLGQGKLIVSPTVVPVWYANGRKRTILVRMQNYVSVAGKRSRPNVNYLVAAPTLISRVQGKWWMAVDTEFKWDWKSRLGSGISGLQIGRMTKH